MVANLEQTAAWIGQNLEEGAETVITALPLYHVFSLTANLLTFLKLGAHNVLITNPRDIPGFIKELKRVPFTAITGVNTLFNALLNAPGIRDINASGLKIAVGGGMAVQRAVAERWERVLRGSPDRRVWPHRDLAHRLRESTRYAGVHWNDRSAPAVHRGVDP